MSVSINNPNQKSVCPTTRSLPIMISLHLQRMAAFHAASMCEDMCACGKICAASARSKKIQVTSWAQTSRPPRSAPRSALRTLLPFAFRASLAQRCFALAAYLLLRRSSLCQCSHSTCLYDVKFKPSNNARYRNYRDVGLNGRWLCHSQRLLWSPLAGRRERHHQRSGPMT